MDWLEETTWKHNASVRGCRRHWGIKNNFSQMEWGGRSQEPHSLKKKAAVLCKLCSALLRQWILGYVFPDNSRVNRLRLGRVLSPAGSLQTPQLTSLAPLCVRKSLSSWCQLCRPWPRKDSDSLWCFQFCFWLNHFRIIQGSNITITACLQGRWASVKNYSEGSKPHQHCPLSAPLQRTSCLNEQ